MARDLRTYKLLRERSSIIEGNEIYYTPDNIFSEVKVLFQSQLRMVIDLRSTIEEIYRDETLTVEERDQLIKPYKIQAFQIAEQLADAYDQLMPTGDTWITTVKNTIQSAISGVWHCLVILTMLFSGGYTFYKIMATGFSDIKIQKNLPNPMSAESALFYMFETFAVAGISLGFIISAISMFTKGVQDLISSIFVTSEEELRYIADIENRLRDGYLFFTEEIVRFSSGSGKCGICSKSYTYSHSKVFLTTCGHEFGETCIRDYTHRGYCPICKVRFTYKDISRGKGVLSTKGALKQELKLKFNGYLRR